MTHAVALRRDFLAQVPARGWTKQLSRVKAVLLYAERDERLIPASRLQPGEKVEVVSDRSPAPAVRYARTIHVVQPVAPPRPLSLGRYRAARNAPLDLVPTGNLTFSGVVFRLNGERAVLHTRETGDQTVLLRADTHYLHDGVTVEARDLKLNTRVYIRAGKNLYDEVEAYQIVWGSILTPR